MTLATVDFSGMEHVLWPWLFYGWGVGEAVLGVRTRTRKGSGKVSDRGTLRLLWLVIVSSVTVSTWISAVGEHNLLGNVPGLRLAGMALLVAGMVLRTAAVVQLGKSFSSNVAIRAKQTVLKTGLYGWMRHPSYTGMVLVFAGIGVHSRNWVGLAVAVVPPLVALLYRIHVEEIALREHFGPEYVAYSAETKRLVPWVY